MDDPSQTVQVEQKPSREALLSQAIAKGKAVAAQAEPAAEEPAPAPEEPAPAPAQEPAEPAAAEEATEPVAADAAEPDGKKPKDQKDPKETKEPKTARAKEWADLKKAKHEVAERERAAARALQEATKTRADLQVIQQELANLNKLRKESPKKFLEAISADAGGMRKLFEEALQEEKRTPEEEEKLKLQARIDQLEAKLAKHEETEAERDKRLEQENEARQVRGWHEQNFKNADAAVNQLLEEGGYPNIARHFPTKQSRSKGVTADVYNRILGVWDGGKGREVAIPVVLDVIEKELADEAGSGSSEASPPARANGADETAKPGAKRAPKSLTNASAAARQSGAKELTGRARVEYFAKRIRQVGGD